MQNISKDLIISAAEGDIEAFEEIYRRSSSYVYTIACRVTGNMEDAEEVTQDVFLSVHRNLKKFRFGASFKTWIYRVTTNMAINAYRKRTKERNRRVEVGEDVNFEEMAVIEDKAVENRENEKIIKSMLMSLPSDQRACLVLKDIEGLSYQEIAEALKIKINTVRTRLKRGRERLISRYGKEASRYGM